MHLANFLPTAEIPQRFADKEVRGLSAHSGNIEPGFVFFAIPGTKANGLSFAPEAIAKGAIAVVA